MSRRSARPCPTPIIVHKIGAHINNYNIELFKPTSGVRGEDYLYAIVRMHYLPMITLVLKYFFPSCLCHTYLSCPVFLSFCFFNPSILSYSPLKRLSLDVVVANELDDLLLRFSAVPVHRKPKTSIRISNFQKLS